MIEINSAIVYGSGCPKCQRLKEMTEKILKDFSDEIPVQYVSDINEMIEVGIISTPALSVNGKIVITGYLPTEEELRDIIRTI